MFWPTVESLFGSSRPTAVFGRIGTVVIDAVNGVTWGRATTHVGKKIYEIVPAGIDGDPATAVARIILTPRIEAPLTNGSPSSIFWCSMRLSMSMVRFTKTVLCPASAGKTSSFEISAVNDAFCPAIATAKPHGSFAVNAREGKDYPAVETLADKIDHWVWHIHLRTLERT